LQRIQLEYDVSGKLNDQESEPPAESHGAQAKHAIFSHDRGFQSAHGEKYPIKQRKNGLQF
jgi:hypothetical protein